MKRKSYVFYSILSTVLLLSFVSTAFAGERSVIIRFQKQPGPSEEMLVHNARGIIKHKHTLIPAVSARLPEEEISNLAQDPRVTYVEEDAVVRLVQPLSSVEYADSWGVVHIGADVAHQMHIMGQGVKVAVLDTGIDCTHPDLQQNCRVGQNFVQYRCPTPTDPGQLCNDPLNTADDSYISHGTNVAGIIGASRNGFGVVGVAPRASLYPVKVLDGGGFGLLSWVLAGIEWAVDHHMDIINMSIEGSPSQSLQDACDMAQREGILIVAAAGNTNGGDLTYPAKYASVVAVTATDKNDASTYFDAIGPEIDLSAPGVDILSTAIGGGYAALSGTSQAAPHVTGTAALLISAGIEGGRWNRAERLRALLFMTAEDLGAPGKDNVFGYGEVDAAKAVSLLDDYDDQGNDDQGDDQHAALQPVRQRR